MLTINLLVWKNLLEDVPFNLENFPEYLDSIVTDDGTIAWPSHAQSDITLIVAHASNAVFHEVGDIVFV